ncbi:hypothetical protein LTR91_024045 [Friedmanniomyces endolithicus]|uniref:Enoyl reductase (ER) domain-containing protein n=1 Tax=Friedmanniomyces endolithicus TaxID=329885 RepID=A0AAN6H167_9PEZI|nr:hypothetical protein LTR94_023667 [Friedmanniomyces endolithicus]KAK0768039.1 hypothetical protein LTR59_017973 [Friedmanniomyces endolithicus]KAK0769210.1 hypothetical protein LTR38_017943 [Friedmanniomyces endolithicus]KAK0770671.1 hypothetical protein LTR75_017857 [Friedmanniomyces endolithicus]KAK0823565.1 hypothetical protein LTR03_017916 [Friedmanniomyces endolithicus]
MPSAITIRKVNGTPGQVWYPLEQVKQPNVQPRENQVSIRMTAAALNHRDLFLRQHLYPGVTFGIPLLADGAGVVVSSGSSPAAKTWLNKRVILNPGSGWKDDPEGPEDPKGYAYLGGTKMNPVGTLTDVVTIDASELEETPKHLSSAEAAALPLTGLTAWRATVTKSGNCKPGRSILITGIGGGVALMALLFMTAAGANVFVTSSSEEKIEKAKKLGAVPGGTIVSYGMTISPEMPFSMSAVLQNIDLRGSTGGSRKEFADMVNFVSNKMIRPIVSRTVTGGLDNMEGIDSLFEDMKSGSQFGKLVIEIAKEAGESNL